MIHCNVWNRRIDFSLYHTSYQCLVCPDRTKSSTRDKKKSANNQHFWSINISCLFWGFFSLTWATVLFLTLCKSQNLFPNKNVPFFSKLKIILTFAKNTVKDRDCTYVTNQPPNINPEAKYRDQSFVGEPGSQKLWVKFRSNLLIEGTVVAVQRPPLDYD